MTPPLPSPVRRSRVGRGPLLLLVALLWTAACGGVERRNLATLTVVDSLYVEPSTGEPFTGQVYRPFPSDAERIQVEGSLLDGTWHGEFKAYHGNGRIRYMGTFHAGARCGAWTENVDSVAERSVYEELLDEIESLGIYPPCP